ncbi:hypothetical protein Calag_1127 [Caldisphaera lagunensis DSM 15908]|uniref:DUF2250 domain-containing protein n=1 Tax=Caldisphaera lagunensis (strain DSM 15908 / JCM 11604 / ANMR 0165 / IC-154) TaxID=1056495 RepID=L0ABP7_CALLD|nr:DUF2250 domain-containing protein [Caldisphaera lagunensis]AFZ70849.1 hypothetical protein Calag_1127 [Caldisphaera lagunensis DSM 15908]
MEEKGSEEKIIKETLQRIYEISPLDLYILFHLKKANVDYGRSIASILGISIDIITDELDKLEKMGLIERHQGSAIKRSEAKFKLAEEVRKHHTYYKLTRETCLSIRKLIKNYEGLNEYFKKITNYDNTLKLLIFLRKAENEHAGTIVKVFGLDMDKTINILEKLENLGLVIPVKEKIIKAKHRKAKPKEETRTHHIYYRITRLTEMILRYSEIS